MPVIMAGIRTAAVWVIGTATLSTPIGQTSLGNYIFAGLQTQNWVFVLFGCVAAAALALGRRSTAGADGARRRRAQPRQDRRRRRRPRAAGRLAALAPGFGRAQGAIVIAAKPFTEQYVLAALIEQRLAAQGMHAERRDGLGSAVIFNALAANDIDAYVDYSGTIWANEMQRNDVKPRARGARAKCRNGWRQRNGIRIARRARLRECLCAGHAARAGAEAPGQIDRRPRRACAAICPSPPTTNSSSARNGRRSSPPTGCISASSAPCSRISCIGRRRPARSTSSSAYSSDGRIAQYDLDRARRSQARAAALRRDAADRRRGAHMTSG